jgi:hypothetical protein
MDLNNVKDFVVETKDVAFSRLKYPLLKFYLFFIIICNWDIILFIFLGDADINMRVTSIKNSIKSTEFEFLGVTIHYINMRWLMPMLYSFISYLLFPYISYEIEKIISMVKNKQMDLESQEKLKIAKNQYEISLELSGKRSYDELNAKILVLEKEKEDNFKLYQQAVEEKDKVFNESIKKEELFNNKLKEITTELDNNLEEIKYLKNKVAKNTIDKKLDSVLRNKLNNLKGLYLENDLLNPINVEINNNLINSILDNYDDPKIKLNMLQLIIELLRIGEVFVQHKLNDKDYMYLVNILIKLNVIKLGSEDNMYLVTHIGNDLYDYLQHL